MKLRSLLSRQWRLTTLAVLAAGAVFVRLGIWQLDRLAERREFNRHVTSMEALPALSLPAAQNLENQEYRAVEASGTYDFEHQVALRNQVYEGQYGYHLLTPLLVRAAADGSTGAPVVVLVDRGWIPAADGPDPSSWRKFDTHAPIQVQGVIRRGQQAPSIWGIGQEVSDSSGGAITFWLYVDLPRISQQLPYPILSVYIQASSSGGPAELPIPSLPSLDMTEGPHMGYALQWFSFAVILLVGYPMYVSRKENAQT